MPSRARIRWARIRFVTMAVVALAILSVLLYLLSPGGLLRRKTLIYTYVPDAAGLAGKSPVRLNGIQIGTIQGVGLSGSNNPNRIVQVRMSVYENDLAKIPADSTAQISADTMVGDRYIDITRGQSRRHIQPGGEVPFQPAPELMKNIDLRQFEVRLRQIDALLAEIQSARNPVGQFIMTDEMYQDVLNRVIQIDNGLKLAVSTTGTLGQMMYRGTVYNQIRAPFIRLEQQVEAIQAGQGRAGQLVTNPAQYEDLRRSLVELRRSLDDVNRAPVLSSDAAYTAWKQRLAALALAVDNFNTSPLMQNASAYETLNGALRQLQVQVRELRQNPQKFMRFKVF